MPDTAVATKLEFEEVNINTVDRLKEFNKLLGRLGKARIRAKNLRRAMKDLTQAYDRKRLENEIVKGALADYKRIINDLRVEQSKLLSEKNELKILLESVRHSLSVARQSIKSLQND